MAERLRRLTRNQIPSWSVGSNPTVCELFYAVRGLFRTIQDHFERTCHTSCELQGQASCTCVVSASVFNTLNIFSLRRELSRPKRARLSELFFFSSN